MNANLICQTGNHNKYWNICVNGKSFSTHWGRIGTIGQSKTKFFYFENACEKEAKNLLASKLKKGYVYAVNEELLTETFIQVFSGIAKKKNENEIYYRSDHFENLATIEFVNGDSSHVIFRDYYESGAIRSQHELVNGIQHGSNLGWYESGSPYWERKFKKGRMVSEKVWK